LSLPDKDAVGLASHMTLVEDFKHKDTGPSLECHEQALPTQQLANPATVGTSAIADVAFQRRTQKETAKPPLPTRVVLKCCGNELIERTLPEN
jgi:hypothetical protein